MSIMLNCGAEVGRRKRLLLAATAFSISLGLRAACLQGTFHFVDFDAGGWFTGFASHPSGRIYGRTDVGGVYRSDNGGRSWQWLSASFHEAASWSVQGIAVATGNCDVVYISTGDHDYRTNDPGRGVWKSADGGITWTQVLAGVQPDGHGRIRWGGPAVCIDPNNDSVVWAGTYGGVYRSEDAGTNWSKMGGSMFDTCGVAVVDVDAVRPGHVWVGGEHAQRYTNQGGLWVSVDSGTNWSKSRDMDIVYRIVRKDNGTGFLVGAEGGSNRLYRIASTNWSDPASYVFTNLTARLDAVGTGMNELVLLALLSDGRLVAGYQCYLTAISSDDGDTWTAMALHATSQPWPVWRRGYEDTPIYGRNEMIEDPLDPDRWLLTTGFGPVASTNEGADWSYITAGVGEVCTFRPDFHPDDSNLVFVGSMDMIGHFLTNGPDSSGSDMCVRTNVYWDDEPRDCPRALMAGDQRIIIGGNTTLAGHGMLVVSTNAGLTWNVRRAHWGDMTGIPAAPYTDGVMAPGKTGDFLVVVGGESDDAHAGIYRTTNGGWAFSKSTGLPTDSGGWYGTDNYPYYSLHADTRPAYSEYRYFFLHGKGFFVSTNSGTSWSHWTGPGAGRHWGVITEDRLYGGNLWAFLYTDAYWSNRALCHSTDGGQTWSEVGDFSFPYSEGLVPRIDAAGGRVALWGRRPGDTHNVIYYSPDTGTNWFTISRTNFTLAYVGGLAVDPYRPGYVWIATFGRSLAVFSTNVPRPVVKNPRVAGDHAILTADDLSVGMRLSVEQAGAATGTWTAITNALVLESTATIPVALPEDDQCLYRLKAAWE